jgi:hypothetical protein
MTNHVIDISLSPPFFLGVHPLCFFWLKLKKCKETFRHLTKLTVLEVFWTGIPCTSIRLQMESSSLVHRSPWHGGISCRQNWGLDCSRVDHPRACECVIILEASPSVRHLPTVVLAVPPCAMYIAACLGSAPRRIPQDLHP